MHFHGSFIPQVTVLTIYSNQIFDTLHKVTSTDAISLRSWQVGCFMNRLGFHSDSIVVSAISNFAIFSSPLLLFVALMIIAALPTFLAVEEDDLVPFVFYGFC